MYLIESDARFLFWIGIDTRDSILELEFESEKWKVMESELESKMFLSWNRNLG